MVPGSTASKALTALLAGVLLMLWADIAAGQVFRPYELEALRATDILGRAVQDARGAPLGVIRDLMIDRRTGKVEYLALDNGAFPLAALRAGDGGALLLDASAAGSASAGGSAAGSHLRASELLRGSYDDLLVGLDGDVRFGLLAGRRVPLELQGH